MAVNYSNSAKTARMTAVRDAIDAAVGPGYIEIGTSGMASILAVIDLADPSGTVTGSVLTFSGMPLSDVSANNSGTAAEARIKDGDGNIIVSGLTVGTSGSDINLNSTTITSGQTVTINSFTLTHG